MEDWKRKIRNAKNIFSRKRSNQQQGKYAASRKYMKAIKAPLNQVKSEIMKDSDSDTDNDEEAKFPIAAVTNANRSKWNIVDGDWIGDPWGNCAQPGQLVNRTVQTTRRPFNVTVTCNNGRTTRRYRQKFEEVYLALKEREDYVELERQINESVARYKEQDVAVPRRFFKSEMPVLAPFDGSYYRARVISTHNSRCKVFFIDYGNEEEDVLNELIYPMQQHFAFLPNMAFPAWIRAGRMMLQEGEEFAAITERLCTEGRVQVRRFGPPHFLGTISEIEELADIDIVD
uniref:Tudor domain-containing protein n=1 Tax=Plectus sambesii TaxID=2011161 RepID=A0A914XP82_9BILA